MQHDFLPLAAAGAGMSLRPASLLEIIAGMRFRVLCRRIRAPLLDKGLRLLACLVVLGLGLTTLATAAKRFVMPHPTDAKAFPAHDEHPLEKVSIAIAPYDTAQKSAIFNTRYLERGLLPMLFVVSNSGSQPVVLDRIEVKLVLRDRSKISPANEDDMYRRLSRTPHNDSGASRLPLPIPPRAPQAGVTSWSPSQAIWVWFFWVSAAS